jgi:hypothetical protein
MQPLEVKTLLGSRLASIWPLARFTGYPPAGYRASLGHAAPHIGSVQIVQLRDNRLPETSIEQQQPELCRTAGSAPIFTGCGNSHRPGCVVY